MNRTDKPGVIKEETPAALAGASDQRVEIEEGFGVMNISAAAVDQLRKRTGMQMMKCKAALTEANGDMEKAVEILRKSNKDAQDKVVNRETAEGRIGVFIDLAQQLGAIVELRCEAHPSPKAICSSSWRTVWPNKSP